MVIIECEQNTEPWYRERSGHPTASSFDKVMTLDMKPSKQAKNYMYQLAAERIAGPQIDTYQSFAMQRGHELENEARLLFGLHLGIEVKQVGLIYPNENKLYSCSPDGFWGEGLEIKCPLSHTHVSYLLAGTLPTEYVLQVQGSMLVTSQDHWFFMSYFPGLPPLILRIERDEKICASLQIELKIFCDQLNDVTNKILTVSS